MILKKARPNYSVISEENGIEKNKDKSTSWIIDPIDGTINFLHGVPHFAISIALQSNNEIICGLIFDPIKDELFYAEKNMGAFFNNQRIRVSKKRNINECLFATGKTNNNIDLTCRRSGCAALDMAYVAAGRYDGYFQNNLNIWDIAAGIVDNFEAGVNEGTIKIENKNNSLLIDSGQCVVIKKKDMLMMQMEMGDEIINNYPGWLNNKIFCNKTSLEYICEEIERIYNIKIVFAKNSHRKITLSGVIDFDKNNLNSVLSSISLLTQREFKLKGDKYIIL